MRMATVREFRNDLSGMLDSQDPVVITRHGKMTGVYVPWDEKKLPIELKRELFKQHAKKMAKLTAHIDEKEMMEHFEAWRKERRRRRGR